MVLSSCYGWTFWVQIARATHNWWKKHGQHSCIATHSLHIIATAPYRIFNRIRSWCYIYIYIDEHSEASHQLIEELMVLAPDTKRGSKNSTVTSNLYSRTSHNFDFTRSLTYKRMLEHISSYPWNPWSGDCIHLHFEHCWWLNRWSLQLGITWWQRRWWKLAKKNRTRHHFAILLLLLSMGKAQQDFCSVRKSHFHKSIHLKKTRRWVSISGLAAWLRLIFLLRPSLQRQQCDFPCCAAIRIPSQRWAKLKWFDMAWALKLFSFAFNLLFEVVFNLLFAVEWCWVYSKQNCNRRRFRHVFFLNYLTCPMVWDSSGQGSSVGDLASGAPCSFHPNLMKKK